MAVPFYRSVSLFEGLIYRKDGWSSIKEFIAYPYGKLSATVTFIQILNEMKE